MSLCAHLLVLVLLALWTFPVDPAGMRLLLNLDSAPPELELDPVVIANSAPAGSELEHAVVEPVPQPTLELSPIELPEIPLVIESPDALERIIPEDAAIEVEVPGGITGRRSRRGDAFEHGATASSEAAVELALKWLAQHQQSTGGWNFDLSDCDCVRQCSDAGAFSMARSGATALALLPFLGAGQTHEKGEYRETVERGLVFLIEQQDSKGSFWEPQGRMYSHGLATLVLCEALAMTNTDPGVLNPKYHHQPKLHRAAQRAIRYIQTSQHKAGGWRYRPREPGDTSVVGWQLMALQSGRMAGLTVSEKSLTLAGEFLDEVQVGRYGSQYGYDRRESRPSTTAIGLLSRMYLGWDRTHPGIVEGVKKLDEWRLSLNNVYYNYYAIQVMHHYRGSTWDKWHPLLRDHLVDTQETEGHEAGSWYFDGDYGSISGGRLYATAMAAMILEVYYRHMPIYSSGAVAEPAMLGD